MGLWPTEKDLQTWIKCHWKPKGIIDLRLGSKGFFTVVFANIEDKDVGNNTLRGVESVLSRQLILFQNQMIYTTSSN